MRQPKDLISKYEVWMESRRLKVIADEEEKKQKEEDEKILVFWFIFTILKYLSNTWE